VKAVPCALFHAAALLIAACGAAFAQANAPRASQASASQAVAQALSRAGANRGEIEAALRDAPPGQRDGMRFLVANMPDADLASLSAKYLLDNVAIVYDAFDRAPWKSRVPKEIFLNDILPYACLNEKRDDSRKFLREKAAPLVADCDSPAEAAQRLNQKLFPLLNARYSTERKRPDQSPLETVASGKATCSGLSILLVDACRAVGVPARVAGTPMWTNMRGNHTWVEVWDGGWHFAGAAEPDPSGLDRGWFTGDAAKAQRDVPQHAIYASSFKRTGLAFPLVWAPDIQWVPAVNVTDRYLPAKAGADTGGGHLLVKVVDRGGKRVAAAVTVKRAGGSEALKGISKDESVDLNDILSFNVPRMCPAPKYVVTAAYKGATVRQEVKAGAVAEDVVVLKLP
jgi:transglutaminase-like putative cysteine protease